MKTDLLNALTESIKLGIYTPTGTQKLEVLHSFIAKTIEKKLENKNIKAIHAGHNQKYKTQEVVVNGRILEKKTDIGFVDFSIDKNLSKHCVHATEIKFPINNIKQNINNLIEGLIGSSYNLENKERKCTSILFLLEYDAYFSNERILKKIDYRTEKDLEKFLKLNEVCKEDNKSLPIIILIKSNNLDYLEKNINKKIENKEYEENIKISYSDIENLPFRKEIKDMLTEHLNRFEILGETINTLISN